MQSETPTIPSFMEWKELTSLVGSIRTRSLVARPKTIEQCREALAYFRWLAARLPTGSELEDVEDARPELQTALERARRFLSLAALCASLLAGIAILLATRRYVDHAMDSAAVSSGLSPTPPSSTSTVNW